MPVRIIRWSLRQPLLVLLCTIAATVAGIQAMRTTPLEALPDLSDVQVIVQATWSEQAPRIIEDQVTYPIAAELLKVPRASVVRGYSYFGVSFVYVIFEDGTDPYWARSRVLETLSGLGGRLPPSVAPTLGPDATGLGWIYQYALEDTLGTHTLAEMRALQDWTLRYALTAVPGVAEVATVGGFEKQYQVDVDPTRLLGRGVSVTQVMDAIRRANADVGAMVLELGEREFMVRGTGYLAGLGDIEAVVVGSDANGTPIRVADVGRVSEGPAVRRGLAELNGRGDAVGGIVVMRTGENALATIERVKERIARISPTLPPGIVLRPVYDRSDLILRAIATLRTKLIEESLVVALVCIVFLMHARSALVAILTLPIGILLAFLAMRLVGVGADIMSLGGIAIAIGAMIDAAIVMLENLHKHLERRIMALPGADSAARYVDTSVLSWRERRDVVYASAREVGPALFFSLLIITVSFLPVFVLEGQEGRLFRPLAFTKTFAMAAASLLAISLVPVAMAIFVRGRIWREQANPLNRWLVAVYRPCITFVLRHRWPVIATSVALMILTWIPWKRMGSEFMPRLDEGTILYMPTTLPGVSVAGARRMLQVQDSLMLTVPEVQHVWGKAGRAETATDPAGMDMFETTIALKPESEWRPGVTMDSIVAELDALVRYPGVTNAWTMPIRARIDMLATGIRTPVGVKIFGPDLAVLERLGGEVERAVKGVPGTRSAFAERAMSGFYLDIAIDRERAARYGLNVGDVQDVIASAVGGMVVTQTVEGRQRFGVRVRYPQELRDSPERLAEVLIPVSNAASSRGAGGMDAMGGAAPVDGPRAQVPLGQVATITPVAGPMVVRTEGAEPTAWVYIDVAGRDIGSYVREATQAVDGMVTLPVGYRMVWSGQYEYMERAAAAMRIVIPATLALIALLLYLNFRRVGETVIVLLSLPFSLVGGLWFTWALGYEWSVAVAIGFIALAGVAAETGVVMLLYLDQAWEERQQRNRTPGLQDLFEAVMEGGVERVRPKLMTVTAIMAGLLPILWSSGTGASVMKRIAAPMVGGMVSSTILTLLVIPAVWSLWQEWRLRSQDAVQPSTSGVV